MAPLNSTEHQIQFRSTCPLMKLLIIQTLSLPSLWNWILLWFIGQRPFAVFLLRQKYLLMKNRTPQFNRSLKKRKRQIKKNRFFSSNLVTTLIEAHAVVIMLLF